MAILSKSILLLSIVSCIFINGNNGDTCGSSTCDSFSDDYYFSYSLPLTPIKNEIVGRVNIGTQLQVSFDLLLNDNVVNNGITGNWRSIISVGNQNIPRLPAFFLYPNDNRLLIRYSDDENDNRGYDTGFELSVGTKYNIVVQVCDGTVSSYVNNELIRTVSGLTTTTGDNQAIYISRPDSEGSTYDAADVTITNLDIRPCIQSIPCSYSHSCTVWGDPHFTMFDGTTHHFQGDGYFDYLKVCDDENGIEMPVIISGKHGNCGYNPYLCILEMIVIITDPVTDETNIISFPSSGSPTFKDSGLSASGTYYFNDNSGYYIVSDKTFEIAFDYNDGNNNQAKIKFYYSGWTLVLETSDCLSGNICGLCGYLSDDSSDDFTRCDNNEIIDNTGSNTYTGTGWTNTHIFGESCCNLGLDTLYLGVESDCEGDYDIPGKPDPECTEPAETICRDAWDIECTLCDNGELTDEWVSGCAMDVCNNDICSNGIINNNFNIFDLIDEGCLETIINSCEVSCRQTLSPTVLPSSSPTLPTQPTNPPTKSGFVLPPEEDQHKDFTWIEANEYCQDNYGTTLATVSNMEELEALSLLALQMRNAEDEDDAEGIKYWIGLSDIDQDGTWHWTDGKENDWEDWNTESRFRVKINSYCGTIRYKLDSDVSSGSSTGCDETRYFVCNSV